MRVVSHPYRLWLWLMLCLVALGCQKSTAPTAPPSAAAPTTPVTVSFGPGESIPAMFEVTIDPVAMRAMSQPLTARTVTGFQASQFDLDITKFQTRAQFDVQSVQFTEIGDVEVTFRHAHPWKAVDITKPPSATNRADLGYTGRLLILADLAPADIPSHTFFTDVKANTELIRGADGYVQPGDLLAKSGFNANCFPYMLLADEAKDNRIGVSNGGVVTGNWDPAVGGWQRSNLGVNGDGWTGYDFVHAGQTIENSFVLNADELTGGPVTLQVALLIKYTEPKGVGGEVGRTLRLPPATVDVLQFAYRAPHAALDVSQIALTDPYNRVPQPPRPDPILQLEKSGTTPRSIKYTVRDWDSGSVESASSDLATEPDIERIDEGRAGPPQVMALNVPGVLDHADSVLTGAGQSGLPREELEFEVALTNILVAEAHTDWTGLLKIEDAGDGIAGSPHFGVDPSSLAADLSRALPSRTFAPVFVRIVPDPPAWSNHLVDPTPSVGQRDLTLLPGTDPGPADDRIAIAYSDAANNQTKLAVANIAVPASAADWNTYYLAPSGNFEHDPVFIHYQDRLFLVYFTNTAKTYGIAQATQAIPLTAADWQHGTIATGIEVGIGAHRPAWIVLPSGRLALVMPKPSSSTATRSEVVLATTSSASPLIPADWTSSPVATCAPRYSTTPFVALLDGRLIVSFRSLDTYTDIVYVEALTDNPLLPSDWSQHTVLSCIENCGGDEVVTGHATSIQVLNGKPVIWGQMTARNLPGLLKATTPHPRSSADWTMITSGAQRGGAGVPTQLGNHHLLYGGDPINNPPQGGAAVRTLRLVPQRAEDWQYRLMAFPFGSGSAPSEGGTAVQGRLAARTFDGTLNVRFTYNLNVW